MGRSYRLREKKSGASEKINKTDATKLSQRRSTSAPTATNPINRIEHNAVHENVPPTATVFETMTISPTETKSNVKFQERTPTRMGQRLNISEEQVVYNEAKHTVTDMNSNSIPESIKVENGLRIERSITKNATVENKGIDMNSNTIHQSSAGRNLLKQLQTSLSPKMSEVSTNADLRVSRYGRHLKQKENINYVPVDLMRYVSKSPAKVKPKKEFIILKGEIVPDSPNLEIGIAHATGVQRKENISSKEEHRSTLLESPSMPSVSKDEATDVLDMDAINIIEMNASFENLNEAVLCGDTIYTTKTLEQNRSLDVGSMENDSSGVLEGVYSIGQIYWAKQTQKTIHWPCIVRVDHETNQITRKRRGKTTEVHVAFFGDRGRRGWIREANMIPFTDLESFCTRVEKGEFGKLVKAAALRHTWQQASKLAEEFVCVDIATRLEQFDIQVKLERMRDISNRVSKIAQKRNGKRDRSSTPESPAYEAIPLGNASKKLRLAPTEDLLMSAKEEHRAASRETDPPINTLLREDSGKNYTELVYKLIVNIGRNFLLNNQTTGERAALLEQYARKISLLKTEGNHEQSKRTTVLRELYQIRQLCQMLDEFLVEKGVNSADTTVMRSKKEKNSLEDEFIFDVDPKTLMKGVPKGFVCYICECPQNVVKCSKCQRHMHLNCVTPDTIEQMQLQTMVDEKRFNCNECAEAGAKAVRENSKCFVCNDESEEAEGTPKFRCTSNLCSRNYHLSCLRCFPQFVTRNAQSIICPYHVCHTCVSDDPRGKASTIKATLVRCIKCPSSYHPDMGCIPAGSEILSTRELICPRHNLDEIALNVNWCFLCCKGGDLICCETCPNAFHRDCIPCAIPEGKYFCEECETGRLPLYNEIVIAKLGKYRWWPGLIVPPSEISEKLLQQRPRASSICVKFFQSRTVAWLNRRRMYLYQHDDSDNLGTKQAGSLDKQYRIAMSEARQIYEKMQEIKNSHKGQLVRKPTVQPPIYQKIKTNQYVPPLKHPQFSSDDTNCYCRSDDEDPCGPTSSCINRSTMIECIPKTCPAKERCSNQRFAKRLYPALEVRHFAEKGHGLVAKETIQCGQFIVEYVGEVINTVEFHRRIKVMQEMKNNNYYFLTVEPDMTIDASAKGNVSRFINHSCEPNCEIQKWSIGTIRVIGLFAIRDIQRGEELTFNYNLETLGNKKRVCLCGAAKCSGFIGEKYRPPIEDPANGNPEQTGKESVKKTASNNRAKRRIKIESDPIDLDDPNANELRLPIAVKQEELNFEGHVSSTNVTE